MAAFAHPDDEAYGPSGAFKAAVDAGVRLRLVIATRGEAGSLGISGTYARDELARIRQWEMQTAARVINAELVLLGYPDKGVEAIGSERGVADLVREIRLFRPHRLITFHPNGLSGHSDHRAMTGYLETAFDAAADPAYRPDLGPPWGAGALYYYAIIDSRARLLEAHRHILSIPDDSVDLPLDVSPWLATKHRICRAHDTQMAFYELLERAEGGLDAYWGIEHLVLGRERPGAANGCAHRAFGWPHG